MILFHCLFIPDSKGFHILGGLIKDMAINYPKSNSLQLQLEQAHPNAPTCAEITASKMINPFLSSVDPSKGMTRMEALLEAYYQNRLENPDKISLTELSRASRDEEVSDADKGNGIRDLFAAFEDEPTTVLDVGEGI